MTEFTVSVNVSDECLGQVADDIYRIARRCDGEAIQFRGGAYQFTVPGERAAEVRTALKGLTENLDVEEQSV